MSLDGVPACSPGGGGPGAQLRYAAGGPGVPGFPGSSGANMWQTTLGMFWSHDHAERIVIDNANEGVGHVWLITRYASFREFKSLPAPPPGTSLRQYGFNSPSDEFRTLYYDDPTASPPGTGNWRLKGLDGTVEIFRPDGLWIQTTFPTDPGHAVTGTYGGTNGAQLQSVSFPDGRSETYTYYTTGAATGKLNTITEIGVGGSPTRQWTYQWSAANPNDLNYIVRPDGTIWEFTYGSNNAPADYLSQVRLIGTDGTSGRVMAAFAYTNGLVTQSWRGSPTFNSTAVDQKTYSYTGLPVTSTQVVEMVSAAYSNNRTYNLARDTVSLKGKILSVTSDCPTCGGAPIKATVEYSNPGGIYPLRPSATVDGRGIRTEYSYDAGGHGRLTELRDAVVSGQPYRKTDWIYDANFPGLVKEIDVPSTAGGASLRTTQIVYDPATSRVSSRTITGMEAGASLPTLQTVYSYNSTGHATLINPPDELNTTADATSFSYDVVNTGRNGYVPDSRTNPVVGTTSFLYDGFNRRTQVTDVNGLVTTTAYDALNRVTSVSEQGPTTLVTSYFYDCPNGAPAGTCGPFQDLRCVQRPNGNGTAYLYDAAGRVVEIRRQASCNPTTQAVEHTLVVLDNMGNRIEDDEEHWDAVQSHWITDGAIQRVYSCSLDKTVSGPRGGSGAAVSIAEMCYDEDANVQQAWDANHARSSFPTSPTQAYTYDSVNRASKLTQSWSLGGGTTAVTQYAYDVQDHLAQIIDAEGNATSYTTSDRDLMTRQVSPVSGTTSYAYNFHGQLTGQADARGITTQRQFDQADRLLSATFSDGTPTITYGYDVVTPSNFGKGRLCSITEGSTAVTYAYDQFGRLTQDGVALAYQYDGNGNRTQITYPGGAVTATYSYDALDRPSTLSYNAGAGPVPVVTQSNYAAAGPLTSLTLGNGLTENHTFDQRYHPQAISVTGVTALNWSYTVDGVGNVTAINDGVNQRTYTYEPNLYYLMQGNGPWGSRSWTYDRIGNRLTEIRDAVTDTYTYSAGGHNPELASIALGAGGTRFFTYDANGNQIHDASPTTALDLAYDAAGRLTKLSDEIGRAASYMSHDGRNFLVQSRQEVNACSPVVTQATYSSDGVLHARVRKNLLTGVVTSNSLVLSFAGRPVVLLEVGGNSPTLTYLSADHLGTPILQTGAAGALLWTGGFEPFGSDWKGAQTAGEFLQFPGQWEDAAWSGAGGAGFEYNLNRWYDTGTGRYRQPDPLGLRGEPGSFTYASDNPIGRVDPTGLAGTKVCVHTLFLDQGIPNLDFGLMSSILHHAFGRPPNQLTFDVACPATTPNLESVSLTSQGPPPYTPSRYPFPGGWVTHIEQIGGNRWHVTVDVPSRTATIDPSVVLVVHVTGRCCCGG